MWQFAQGLASRAWAVVAQVQWAAQQIANMLHFSVPKEGPLSTADRWMPDMMKLFAEGIQSNTPMLQGAAARAAGGIASGYTGGVVGGMDRCGTTTVNWTVDGRVLSQLVLNRSEEHTSELQSHLNLVCRLLLEKKKQTSRCDSQWHLAPRDPLASQDQPLSGT